MAKLWKNDPFDELGRAGDVVRRAMELPSFLGSSIERSRLGSMSMDVFEDDTSFNVKASLPGLKPDEIEVNVENDVLTISGEHKHEKEVKKANYYRKEISEGSFERALRLPDNLNVGKIDASYEDGILNVTIPKAEVKHTKPLKVEVHKKGAK